MNTIPKNLVRRLLDKDMTLWPDSALDGPEPCQLDWLDAVSFMKRNAADIMDWAARTRNEQSVDHVMLIGMGGSSMAADVMYSIFRQTVDGPRFSILDTVSPAYLAKLDIDFENTLFIISSKSGTTIETADLHAWALAAAGRFDAHPGQRFIAITDPGSRLEKIAAEQQFLRVFLNPPGIGGRFSALSYYGLVPAALFGVDLYRLQERTRKFAEAAAASVSGSPILNLVQAMVGEARLRCSILEIDLDDSLQALFPWIEQLIAESTGKNGVGILPVRQGQVFNSNSLTEVRHAQVIMKRTLRNSAFPECVMQDARQASIAVEDPYDIGGEFLRWQMATVLAASALGVNPFNQPDVDRTKSRTKELIRRSEENQYREIVDTEVFTLDAHEQATPGDWPCCWPNALEMLSALYSGGYLAILAYLPMWPSVDFRLMELARALPPSFDAVTVGFGPRYLHSTGQLHKGGTQNGRFLQILDLEAPELMVPGRSYGFWQLHRAQAEGDASVLAEIGLPVMRIRVKADRLRALETLTSQLLEFRAVSTSN